jgi:tryptophan halogenase
MADASLRNILIVGGGLAGWMSAAVLSKVLSPRQFKISIVDTAPTGLESLDGGEAGLPSLTELHALLGVGEAEFVRDGGAGFSLGTAYVDWPRQGAHSFRPFGDIGARLDGLAFHHYWLRLRAAGEDAALSDYALGAAAAQADKFAPPVADQRSVLSTLDYAQHWRGEAYRALLRARAERQDVVRIAGEIADVKLRGADGFIEGVTLRDGQSINAELFIDCTSAGDLIEGALNTGFEDWRQWLPCDRAIAGRPDSTQDPAPFRTATAGAAGWSWTIPLRSSVGRGHVYASEFMSDDDAGRVLGDAGAFRAARFVSGRRRKPWVKNCVAIGPAACVLDPLESTAVQIAQKGLTTLAKLMPEKSWAGGEADEYNRIMIETVERLRDFTALRYLAGARADTPFWAARRGAGAPESLAYKMELFAAGGRVYLQEEETFSESDWAAAWLGQELYPRAYSPLADTPELEATRTQLQRMRAVIAATAAAMPTHGAFLRQAEAQP